MSSKYRRIFKHWMRIRSNVYWGIPFVLAGIPLDIQRDMWRKPCSPSPFAQQYLQFASERILEALRKDVEDSMNSCWK